MPTAAARIALAVLATLLLGACASTTPTPPPEPSYQPIDNGVPELETLDALGLLNRLRATAGAPPLVESKALDDKAAALASTYALGIPPGRPNGVLHLRYVKGKVTFGEALAALYAEKDGGVSLVDRASTQMGVASVVFDGPGAYWVLLLS